MQIVISGVFVLVGSVLIGLAYNDKIGAAWQVLIS